jgi:hypothetical protein
VSELYRLMPRFLPLLPPVIFLVAVLLILRETRHGIAKFSELIQAAWADEWHGRERVGKCNRGGAIIAFTVTLIIFLIQQAHSLLGSFLGSPHPGESTVIWLFIFDMAFLLTSLFILANMEKHKMLHGRRRRAPTRR